MVNHGLTAAKIRYLVVLCELDPEKEGVRSIRVAKKLNVSRPSVHAMMTKLADCGYIRKEHYGIVYLTDRGREIGARYAESYRQ